MLKLQVPLSLFHDGDAVNTRAQLLLIKESGSDTGKLNEDDALQKQPDTTDTKTVEENAPVQNDSALQRKRVHHEIDSENEDENYTACGKKDKLI